MTSEISAVSVNHQKKEKVLKKCVYSYRSRHKNGEICGKPGEEYCSRHRQYKYRVIPTIDFSITRESDWYKALRHKLSPETVTYVENWKKKESDNFIENNQESPTKRVRM